MKYLCLFLLILSFACSDEPYDSSISEVRSATVLRGKEKIAFQVDYHLYLADKEQVNGDIGDDKQIIYDTIQSILNNYSIDDIRSGIKPELLNKLIERNLLSKGLEYIVRTTTITET